MSVVGGKRTSMIGEQGVSCRYALVASPDDCERGGARAVMKKAVDLRPRPSLVGNEPVEQLGRPAGRGWTPERLPKHRRLGGCGPSGANGAGRGDERATGTVRTEGASASDRLRGLVGASRLLRRGVRGDELHPE